MTMQTLIKKMALCLFLNMGLTFCFVIAQEALLRQGSEGLKEAVAKGDRVVIVGVRGNHLFVIKENK